MEYKLQKYELHFKISIVLVLLSGIHSAHSKDHKDADLVFDELPPLRPLPLEYDIKQSKTEFTVNDGDYNNPDHWIVQSMKRLKRSIDDLFIGDVSDPKTKTKSHLNLKDSITSEKKKKKNTSRSISEKQILKTIKKHTPITDKRRKRQHVPYDIENDDDDPQISGSGDYDILGREQDRDRWFRIFFEIIEQWNHEYEDKGSQVFKTLSRNLSGALENLYNKEKEDQYNHIYVNVVNVEQLDDSLKLKITADITSEQRISSSALNDIIRQQIRNYRKVGDYLVGSTGYQFRIMEGRANEEDKWLESGKRGFEGSNDDNDINTDHEDYEEIVECHQETQFKCQRENKCISILLKCDSRRDCQDGSDEESCSQIMKEKFANDSNEISPCYTDEFRCDLTKCISISQHCDKTPDCDDGTDEEHCPSDCSDDEFKCFDGTCIDRDRQCDRRNDCSTGEDEENCSNSEMRKPKYICPNGMFICGDLSCVSIIKRCDGKLDCPRDDFDEQNCPCVHNEWQCDYGTCIAIEKKCNGNIDCPDDTSDERYCPNDNYCADDEFACDDNHNCISALSICDGIVDCLDKTDEKDCEREDKCSTNEYRCDNGLCVHLTDVCDGYHNCIDGSDEQKCDRCRRGAFHCHSDECIEDTKRCDGIQDCSDWSDEEDCDTTTPPHEERFCQHQEWQCKNGECINQDFVCDGTADCIDNSDESNCTDDEQEDCEGDEFLCDGRCFEMSRRCDGFYDCLDKSDEHGCLPVISSSTERICPEFTCQQYNQCYSFDQKCDGIVHCRDSSDEENCLSARNPPENIPRLNLKTYPNDQIIKESREVVFQCRDEGPNRARVQWLRAGGNPLPKGSRDINGRLEIPNIKVSDSGQYICEAVGFSKIIPGSITAVTLSVEKYNSIDDRPIGCSVHQATCMNGDCIPRDGICNGIYDCLDGSDELSCSNHHGCEPNEFKCRNQKCVLKTWRCDSENDCGDNSDEENCATLSPDAPCRYDEFQCRNSQCIPKSFHCDSHPDCLDSSDEIGCSKPTVVQQPPARVNLKSGSIFNITCRAVGVPTPLIVWRLNWGHIPNKCITSSKDGFGVLTCNNIEVKDSGAYSCEIINSMGTHFVSPDTTLIVDGGDVCRNGYFNAKASKEEECINCFCFGVSNQCSSADLFVYSLPTPATSLNVVGVEGPWSGANDIRISDYRAHDLLATRHGVQLRLSELPLSKDHPYYALPDNYHGNQLKSYGGFLRYDVEFYGNGASINSPDIIIMGNGYTLFYRSYSRLEPSFRHSISAQFSPGDWYKLDGLLASREDIMMTLANIENVLIKLQYLDNGQREVELLNIIMDSAANVDRGLGSASLVEECRCPVGYTGLSCEKCAYGYIRQQTGPWLGRCVIEEEPCRPGTYGDPNRSIPCKSCPCPTPSNSFASTCYLGSDGDVICNCERGYTGRRCEQCASGWVGNPMIPGQFCQIKPVSDCNKDGTETILSDGRCLCKTNVVGSKCDRCAVNAFYLNSLTSGCIDCFCMGVTKQCSSSSYYRNSIQSTFSNNRNDFTIIYDYEEPQLASDHSIYIENREIVFRNSKTDDTEVYYWNLPTRFVGNKITSYGGYLNYTLRFKPLPAGFMSRNNAPDVVIKSVNDITILHYRKDEVLPRGYQTYAVPVLENYWQRSDGIEINREHLLMALADVSYIFIKATYTTMTEEAALSEVTLDIATPKSAGSYNIALEVEQCVCPIGHTGLSCEDCAPGYKRSDDGIYLGLCEPCECNNHSDDCDPKTGVCRNCRDNTKGDSCEFCLHENMQGNATRGTPFDCIEPEASTQCNECDISGYISCINGQCQCKSNVIGSRCDYCREGAFNLQQENPLGCTECFCSGATTSCQSSRLYREEIPMNIFDQDFSITDRDNSLHIRDGIAVNIPENKVSYNFHDDHTYFWSLPARFTGYQILSYGGTLTFNLETEGQGNFIRDQDVIMRGSGITLIWEREEESDGAIIVPLIEGKWYNQYRTGLHIATRSDLLTVLANLECILIRASVRERTDASYISDIILQTAAEQPTRLGIAESIEVCRCPEGYIGTSCEQCDYLFYRDVTDHGNGLSGSCKRCPCSENAVSCSLKYNQQPVCLCRQGYYGDYCDQSEPVTQYPIRPVFPPLKPTITVKVTSPVIEIVEVGKTVQVNCSGHNIITNTPIIVTWFKLDGRMSERAFEKHGTLIITNTQIDDSGVYVCRGQSNGEIVEDKITITVGGSPRKPHLTLSSSFIDGEEETYAEVFCEATGVPTPIINWQRLNGEISPGVVIRGGLLQFNSLHRSHEGDYRCVGQNQFGEDDQILHVYVRELPQSTPTIQIMPGYYKGIPGDEIKLNCTSRYQTELIWTKSELPISSYNILIKEGILTIRNAQIEDSGRYTCQSYSPSTGTINSANIEVIIQPQLNPPTIKPMVEHNLIVQGSDFSISCEAYGNPYPIIKWTKLSQPFDSNTQQMGNSLRIVDAHQSNYGVYVCIAENDAGSDQASTVIEIDPRQSPILELHPQKAQTIRVGESAMLSCRATAGIPPPTITWSRRDRKPLSSHISEEYPGTIIIREATIEDAGEYECRAENIAGSTSLTTALHVQQPPIIRMEPGLDVITLTEGDELNVLCFAEGIPRPNLKWIEPLSSTTTSKPDFDDSRFYNNQPSASLLKYEVSQKDAGIYTCVAHNSAGHDEKYIQVAINAKRGDIGPYDTDYPYAYSTTRPHMPTSFPTVREPYKVSVGDRSTLSCHVEDFDKVTTWRREDGRGLPTGSFLSGGDLIIEHTQYDAAGRYECVFNNDDGPIAIAVAEIVVVEMPHITFSPSMPMVVRSGENVVIYCNVSGDQPIRVNWHAENDQSLPRTVRVSGQYLEFHRITPVDAGRYYCTAENIHGNVTKVAEVIVNRNEIIDNRPQQDKIQEVNEGDNISLNCNVPNGISLSGAQFSWKRDYGYIPSTARYDNNRLILFNIHQNDAGRYVCQMAYPDGQVSQNYVEVRIKPAQRLPFLKLEPSRSFLRLGDSIEIDCTSSTGPNTNVIWEKFDGKELPFNFKQIGNRLRITNVQKEDAGLYTCKCSADDGNSYTSEYELKVEEDTYNSNNNKKNTVPTKIEYAEVGSTIDLKCNSDRHPVEFFWSRPNNPLQIEQEITKSDLRLIDVQAKDAGTYICRASHNGDSVEIPTILVITGAIPYFPQAPKSYMVFPKLDDAYYKFHFEVTFKPEHPNGLILYNGQKKYSGDYIALSLNEGYPEFRFDFGNQPTVLRAENPLEMGHWHTVKVNRVRKDGFMVVNSQAPIPIPSHVRFQGLDLIENLYLGGVPKFEDIASTSSTPKQGFVGCISRLILKDQEIELKKHYTFAEGITSCEPCAEEPCQNGGVCLETQSEVGYTCICSQGYTGRTCSKEGLTCRPGICGVGRCDNTGEGINCLCPLNRTGDQCQFTEFLNKAILSFKDGSFATYRAPKPSKLNIEFSILPINNLDSIVLYLAESDHGNGDFAAVVLKNGHIEFRINTGAKLEPVVIRSKHPLVIKKFTNIIIGRRHGESYLQVGEEQQQTSRNAGASRSMILKTPLYIGGYDKRISVHPALEIKKGFDGCISDLKISSQQINMIEEVIDAANIKNCDENTSSLTIPSQNINNEIDENCQPGYEGKYCDTISDICIAQNPCLNGGLCVFKKDFQYDCICPLGFNGHNCQNIHLLELTSYFKGNGYLELNHSVVSNSANQSETALAILFSTSHPNGLLAWYGQNKGEYFEGQDFVALAVVDGYLEYAFRLNGEEAIIKNINNKVNDGNRHVAIFKRNGNQASLEVDQFIQYGESRPTEKKEMILPGNIFIGGAPDLNNFTGNRYSSGFFGCIHIIEPMEGGPIHLGEKSVSASNVDSCPNDTDVIDLGPDPPVV